MAVELNEAASAVGVAPHNMRTTIGQGRFPSLDTFSSIEEVKERWFATIIPQASETAANIALEGHNLGTTRLRNEIVKLHLAVIELEERKEALIYKDVVDKAWRELAQRIREGLMGLPARHAPILAAEYGIDPHKIYLDLETMMRDFCTRISDEITYPERRFLGGGAKKRE